MRILYLALIYAAMPFVGLFWLWRAFREPSYRDRLGQRFGFGAPQPGRGTIWVHAVSVGEVQAAAPLVRTLMEKCPHNPVVITTVTPTGADRVRLLFDDDVHHAYIPFDTLGAVTRFYDAITPSLAVIVETELWPNLFHICGKRDIPLVLASARISPRSVERYRKLVGLFRMTLSHGIIIGAQSDVDKARFLRLGAAAERTFVCGNIKFDYKLDPSMVDRGAAFRERHFGDRPVWVAASTHEGEEAILIDAHNRLRERIPDAVMLIVPRHPQRFEEAAQLLGGRGIGFVRRTEERRCRDDETVMLGDTMGEMLMFYGACDIAFVGGSLVPIGGHNLLEPAAFGLPIVTGPFLFNGEDIAQMFTESGAATVVEDADELASALGELFSQRDRRTQMGRAAGEILRQNRGSIRRLLTRLDPILDSIRSPAPPGSD